MKETPWSRILGTTAWTEFLETVGNGKPTGSVLLETIAVSATILIGVENDTVESVSEFFHAADMSENHREPEVPEEKVPVVELVL